jgi:alpha-glucosidase
LPDDIFYDFWSHETVHGEGKMVEVIVPYTDIPLYYKGGSIIAQRSDSANTTTELRKKNFSVVIAPGLDGAASGSLYLDDGVSLEQAGTTYIQFHYSKKGVFSMTGSFGYDAGVSIENLIVLGGKSRSDKQVPIHEPIRLKDKFSLQT